MVMIKIKGYEFPGFAVKDSFNRRAVQFQNQIISSLRKLGIPEHQTDIPLETFALKNAPASATWFFEGHRLYFSYDSCGKFVENLYVVAKVIALEVEAIESGAKTIADFITDFTENEDVVEQRKKARETLGVGEDTKDMTVIDKRFKELAKEHHPDTGAGNLEKFKEINRAHKTLKRELS